MDVMMIDGHGRKINYLRLSVTDRCNFRCRYCMPADGEGVEGRSHVVPGRKILELVSKRYPFDGIRRGELAGGDWKQRSWASSVSSRRSTGSVSTTPVSGP